MSSLTPDKAWLPPMETYLGQHRLRRLITKLSIDDACANDSDHKDELGEVTSPQYCTMLANNAQCALLPSNLNSKAWGWLPECQALSRPLLDCLSFGCAHR